MPPLVAQIAENLARVRQNIAEAARASGRPPDAVQLVGVTKYVGVETIRALVEAGCRQLGESRPQQLWQRVPALDDRSARWHLIGHLQRNKVERTLPLVHMIHSVDSLRLATAINESAAHLGRKIPVLLEVNISGEEAKHGLPPAEMEPLLAELSALEHLEVLGLMGMASLEGGLDAARRDFARLRELRDQLRCHCPPGIGLDELSMGMSGDYEVAIREGATIVRVGSALFEGLLP
jgi:pyridoxal phosphate enzyme (YggS family)